MVYSDAAFLLQLFDMPVAQGIYHVPAHAREHDVLGEMSPFEAHRYRRSPSLYLIAHSGRASPTSLQMKIATDPLSLPMTH